MMNLEELEEDFKNLVTRSGAELVGVLFQGSISKLADEYWAKVEKAQRAMGEAEAAKDAALATRGADEMKIIDLRKTAAALESQIRDRKAELANLDAERAELSPRVAALKAEDKHYGERMAKIMGGVV